MNMERFVSGAKQHSRLLVLVVVLSHHDHLRLELLQALAQTLKFRSLSR